jgi:hypothetical protein
MKNGEVAAYGGIIKEVETIAHLVGVSEPRKSAATTSDRYSPTPPGIPLQRSILLGCLCLVNILRSGAAAAGAEPPHARAGANVTVPRADVTLVLVTWKGAHLDHTSNQLPERPDRWNNTFTRADITPETTLNRRVVPQWDGRRGCFGR